ncbi:MAG: hypothetical protein KDC68_05505, partial [Gelidibacter sp.]|nr:hypothetical protein [Gelidibacter sp.]
MWRHFFLFISILIASHGYTQSVIKKDRLTIKADSLHLEGEYQKALALRNQAIKQNKKASKDEIYFLKAKYFHT